jgi:hypothetical protein
LAADPLRCAGAGGSLDGGEPIVELVEALADLDPELV